MHISSRLKQEISALRFILAALLISIITGISQLLYLPNFTDKIDFIWTYLLCVTSIAALATYVSYKRKLRELNSLIDTV